jgi:hypothetical protein
VETLHVTERTGKDGMLHIVVPLGKPEQDFVVVVIVQATATAPASTNPEKRGWPPGYFDLAGSIDDATFERPPQGMLPKPVELE